MNDAEAILKMRATPAARLGLTPLRDDVDAQAEWIKSQRRRTDDYYFAVVESHSGLIVGTVGLVAPTTHGGLLSKDPWIATGGWEWGRWLSVAGSPAVSLESAALILRFAESLATSIWVRILRENTAVLRFHERLPYGQRWETQDAIFMWADLASVSIMVDRLSAVAGLSRERDLL